MNGPESVLNMLDTVLSRVEADIHELEILDAEFLESSNWYRSSRPDRRKMLEKSAEALLHQSPRTRGPHLRRVDVTGEESARLAQSMAHTTLFVLVENRESDGALVRAAMDVFATKAACDLCFGTGALASPPAFSFDSGGGHGELPKVLAQRLNDAADRGLRPRIVVIADSDGEWIGDVKNHATKIRNRCTEAKVPCPPLNKRTAENYIPDAVWQAWAAEPDHTTARPVVDALLRLSYHQRDHVRIGSGNEDPWDSAKPPAASLFADVPDTDRELLKRASLTGRGSNAIASMFERYRSEITTAGLQARDRAGDLEAVARFIEGEL